MVLENDRMKLEISENGAELKSLFDKKYGEERLWNGDPEFWKRTSPVLFPNVGKVFGGVMRTNKGEFALPQHGFARDMVFEIVDSSDSTAEYRLRANAETMRRFAYDFQLDIKYELRGNEVVVTWKVMNYDTEKMSFTIGGHPAFLFPEKNKRKDGQFLYFHDVEKLEFKKLDPTTGCAKADTACELKTDDGYVRLCEEMFFEDALIFDNAQIMDAVLCDEDKVPYIELICEGFPNFGIWSVRNAPFVCLEPWQGRCDDYGFSGNYSEKTGAITLDPGDSCVKSYKIRVL